MKTIELKLYSFNELSDKAKAKALDDWNKYDDMPFLSDYLESQLEQELECEGIYVMNNSLKIQYSLGYSQGDGAMFEGSFRWKEWDVGIKQNGMYTHYNSKVIELLDKNGAHAPEQAEAEFNDLYIDLCKKLTKWGYDYIEEEQSIERFTENCEANEYTFEEDGTMRNA